MANIRKATLKDVSRIAEILIFSKRVNYRKIFNDDQVSFGEMQVVSLAEEYVSDPKKLDTIWVYDDGFVKAMINFENKEVKELYVDPFFVNNGIGGQLLAFAIQESDVGFLWVLTENHNAIKFYERQGFKRTGEIRPEQDTTEFKMVR